jgi:hypothetical protein
MIKLMKELKIEEVQKRMWEWPKRSFDYYQMIQSGEERPEVLMPSIPRMMIFWTPIRGQSSMLRRG